MSPKDPKSGGIAQKWLPDTKVADMPPVGPSPILIHVADSEAEYVFLYPTSTREDTVLHCIQLLSAVFTVFLSVVFTRCSEGTAHTVFPP